jgi:hypothetical protein
VIVLALLVKYGANAAACDCDPSSLPVTGR